MEGEEYVVINPDTLSDKEYFSYRDIQRLCCKLNIGGNGTRTILEDKLRKWHRNRDNNDISKALADMSLNDPNSSPLPMNVPGNNFTLLSLDIRSKSTKSRNIKRRNSVVGLDNGAVSPTLLRPLNNANNFNTPTKSILKSSNNDENVNININSSKKLDKITFSPFNGVKVITNRVIQNKETNNHLRFSFNDNDDDDDYNEDGDDYNEYENEIENDDMFENNQK